MIPIERTFTDGISPKVDTLNGYTFTGEEDAHVFIISRQSESGQALDFEGSATTFFMRADGSTLTVAASISNGKIYATLSGDCYNVPGRFTVSVYNVYNGSTTCVYAGVGNVYRTRNEPVIDSGEVVPSLDDVTALFEQMEQARDDANAAAMAANAIGDGIIPYNAYDVLSGLDKTQRTGQSGGLFTWNGSTLKITGELTGTSSYEVLLAIGVGFPNGVGVGSVLHLAETIYPFYLGYAFYDSNNTSLGAMLYISYRGQSFTVPDNAASAQIIVGINASRYESGISRNVALLTEVKTNPELFAFTKGLLSNNPFNVLSPITKVNATISGVDFTWDGEKCTLTGAWQSGDVLQTLFESQYYLPYGVVPGSTIYMDTTIAPAYLSLAFSDGVNWSTATARSRADISPVTVPDNAVGMRIKFGISVAFTSPLEVYPRILANEKSISAVERHVPVPKDIVPDVAGGFDFNNATECGLYVLAGGRTYLHAPWTGQSVGRGHLFVDWGSELNTSGNNYLVQTIWMPPTGMWMRDRGSNGVWTNWVFVSVPPAPTTNGTYNLRCVVSGGAPTYSWVST